ncbi:MAG: polyphosphate kinase 1, partial [Candidatus Thiodiazotropha sp. (ex Ctena orbiculata)]|nr:polyphosphate kinase 1 [Candidatus Thiodiazotropha taylori]
MNNPEQISDQYDTPANQASNESSAIDLDDASLYLNRELTWLAFNRRVLAEASREKNPLLERVKFLAIVSNNLDEFFMKRIGGLKQQVAAGISVPSVDGRTPMQQLEECHKVTREMQQTQEQIYNELLLALSEEEIRITEYKSLNEHQQAKLRDHFQQNIFPMLTPLAMDPSHPFPFISNLTLNLLVTLRFPGGHDLHMARVKVPVSQDVSSRLIKVGEDYTYVTLDDLIANNLDMLFPGMAIESCDLFRVTRNANVELDQEAANDLLESIESELRERHFAPIVRLEISNSMNAVHRGMLAAELGLDEEQDVYIIEGMMALRDLFELTKLNLPELHDIPHHPVDHPQLAHDRRNIFHILRDHQGLLLQHPYESFSTTVERFLRTAAEDPKVLAIKMTLYRTSADGNVLDSLIKAARNGKQVAVLVELKARFDEAANIRWARRLEQAGIHVTYGVLGLKTHSKLIMVIRKDYSQLRRYYHIGTGNYHAGTARLYTDLGLLGCDEEIGKDLTEQFNYLTGYSPPPSYRKILAAPYTLKQSLLNKIEREIKIHRESCTGHIQLKMNALEDPDIVKSLYKATQAGVKVELIVRDTCRFRPGIKGLSESGSVVSIVGRFLEHARITYFHNGGDEEYFIGSADLMRRNLKQRVEVLVPVEAPALRQELRLMLDVQLGDKHNAWDMQSDGTYIRRTPAEEDKSLNCQETLIGVAERRLEAAKKHREKRMREKLMTHFK